MLNNFISVITSLGVTLQEFTYISIIGFIWYFPIKKNYQIHIWRD